MIRPAHVLIEVETQRGICLYSLQVCAIHGKHRIVFLMVIIYMYSYDLHVSHYEQIWTNVIRSYIPVGFKSLKICLAWDSTRMGGGGERQVLCSSDLTATRSCPWYLIYHIWSTKAHVYISACVMIGRRLDYVVLWDTYIPCEEIVYLERESAPKSNLTLWANIFHQYTSTTNMHVHTTQ